MHKNTTTAGSFNFALKGKLEARYPKVEVQALLRQLSAFHVASDYDLSSVQGSLPSEIVVLHNLLQRGTPTMPSLAVEKALTALGFTLETIDETSIRYDVTDAVNDVVIDEVFTALHVVDNRYTPSYQGILESRFEEEVFSFSASNKRTKASTAIIITTGASDQGHYRCPRISGSARGLCAPSFISAQ